MSAAERRPPAASLEAGAPLVLAICHDIAGPLASLGLGLDLLEEGGEDAAEGLAIARNSLGALGAQLAFTRAAFSRSAAPVAMTAVVAAALGLVRGGGSRVAFEIEAANVSAPAARLVLHLTRLALASLPAGGSVRLSAAGARVEALAEGPGARSSPAMSAGLALQAAPTVASADWAKGLAVALAANDVDGAVRVEAAPDHLRYVVETDQPVA